MLSPLFLFAQKVGFGPKIGPNVSIFRGDFPIDGMRKPQFGFSAGGFLNIRWMDIKKFQLEIDVLYTMRGHKSEFFNTVNMDPDDVSAGPDQKSIFNYRLGYIEVPIIFKYMLNKSGMTRPYLFGGVTYSGLLTAKFTDGVRGSTEDAREFLKRDDLGLNLGWGITSFIIDRWYYLDIRYFHGFLNSSEFIRNDLQPFKINTTEQVISPYRNSTLTITLAVSLEKRNTFFLR